MNAQQLKNSILQEAIEGRLVPQDPNDEPASVLLDKIRKEKARLVKEGKLKKKDLEEIPISEDEKPFEIPETWEWVRLGEISTYANTKKKINAAQADSNLWGLDLEDIEKGGRLLCLKSVGERKAIGDKTYFSEGDILYSKLRPYLLKILIAPKNGICTPEIIPFTCYGCISKEFVVNLLKSAYVDDYINSVTFGVKMPRVSTETMVSLVIPLPPLAEQKRIVAKIEELLPKVEKYGKAQETLDKLNEELPERLKKSILQEAIEGRLVPQDPNDEPASVLLDKIRKEKARLVKEGKLKKKDFVELPISEDEIPFKIPESWEWCRFGAVVKTFTGKTPERGNADYWCDEDYPWVSISDMKQGETLTTTKERISSKAAEKCFGNQISPKGSLIMSFKLTVGRTSFLGIDAYHNEAIITIETLSDPKFYTRNYYSHILPLITNWGDSKDAIKGKTLNSKSIYNLLIPMPPYNEQKRIVTKIEELLRKIDKLKA